jgi:Phospholipase_D-nuclease N-terminal/Short C-terminal domain
MLIAADYPFLDVFWTIIVFFAWLAWIWIAITCFIDIFRRHDIGGGHKALWIVFIIAIPFVGVLVYLIAQHDGIRERSVKQAQDQQAAFDSYVKQTAGGSASEIAKAKELLDAGTITQQEFDSIKAKALG